MGIFFLNGIVGDSVYRESLIAVSVYIAKALPPIFCKPIAIGICGVPTTLNKRSEERSAVHYAQ